jgi:hypothetical protein
MADEIGARLVSAQIRVAELDAAAQGAAPDVAADLQRQIEETKRAAWADVWAIRARWAHAEGRPEEAARLEAVSMRILDPESASRPEASPAPGPDPR